MNRILTFLIYGIFLISCREIVEVDLPEIEMKPVVNCLFSPDSPFKVHVSLPKSTTDTTTYNIANAEVTISGEGSLEVRLAHVGGGVYTNSNLVPAKGISYTLKVGVPGYPELSAIGSIPSINPRIIGYTTLSHTGYDEEGGIPFSEIRILIKDPDGENYYGLEDLYGENTLPVDTTDNGVILWAYGIFSNDPVVLNEGINIYYPEFLVFSDEIFQGEKYCLSVNFYSPPEKFILFNYSKIAFKYV